MKKVLALAFVAAALFAACGKEDIQNEPLKLSRNRVITIPADDKTAGSTIFMMSIGHDGKNCKGCVMYGGQLLHEDCMGPGNYCTGTAAVQIQQTGTIVTATTTDTFGLTSLDFFFMPDRSLDYVDEKENHIYLNIPSQLVYRDATTLQFTFTGLYFSNTAAYSNN